MEGAKEDLGDKVREVDDWVVNLSSVLCNPALFEPDLEVRIYRKKELGREFNNKAFPSFEAWSVAVDHCLKGAKGLGSYAQFSKVDVICDHEHF